MIKLIMPITRPINVLKDVQILLSNLQLMETIVHKVVSFNAPQSLLPMQIISQGFVLQFVIMSQMEDMQIIHQEFVYKNVLT